MQYVLEGRMIRPEPDLMRWAMWMGAANRRVAQTFLHSERYGRIRVSTVFLGLRYPCGNLFETMVFREKPSPEDDWVRAGFWGEMERTASFEQAEEAHRQVVADLKDLGMVEWIKRNTPRT